MANSNILSCDDSNDMKHDSCMIIPLPGVHHFEDNNHLFPEKISNSDECWKESVSDSVLDFLSKHSYVCGSDLKSCFDLEKMDNRPYIEDAPSGSVGSESSADHHKHLTDRQFRQDMEHSSQTISSESKSAFTMYKDWSKDVISTCPESFSFSEDLAVQGARTSPKRSSQVGTRDGSKRTFAEQIAQDGYSPISKLHNELDNAKDKDATASV